MEEIIKKLDKKFKILNYEYIDEKLKSIEWDIKVLRNRVNMALVEGKEL